MIGKKISHYSVTEKLGAGGMGEVYRARDTKLNRDVALKVLPEVFAKDGQRMARFSREAQVLASLNHPNIASIYGLEESDGIRCLVLELVEGPTLAERIKAEVQAGNCACEVKNPSGKCCLGNVTRTAPDVLRAVQTAAGMNFPAWGNLVP